METQLHELNQCGRVGLVRMMSRARAITETIMRQSWWQKAEMVRRYIRMESAGAGPLVNG